jgi:hypothetical protein
MTRAKIAGGALAAVLFLLAVVAGYRAMNHDAHPAAATAPAIPPGATPSAETFQGFLYGRITAADGSTLEGRLRWGGGDGEAFWNDYFNGSKRENTWLAQVPPEQRPKEHHQITIFGIKVAEKDSQLLIRRQLVVRFGEIARIEAIGRDVLVTLKSGTVFTLDRFEASDFDDDVRVWDAKRGVVDVDSLKTRTIELLPTPAVGGLPSRLHGTVHTPRGDFTGFVLWNRQECLGVDTLDGRTADGKLSLRFDTIRSIARREPDSSVVTLLDGREIVLTGTRAAGDGNRGIYVDDLRYGRVLISWETFERLDFGPGGSAPAYGDFPPGRPLTGTVTTRAGLRHTGRLVYDLDESETTEMLDGESDGVDYSIPFGLVASIVPPADGEPGTGHAKVTLGSGEELQLARAGDLGEQNAGMLIFGDGGQRPEYVLWTDVKQVDFDRPPR